VTDRYDAEPPVSSIQAWRERDWVLVALDGEVVWRRLTRDRAFTQAQVRFQSHRSPSVPKSRLAFHDVELRGDWRLPRSAGHWNNSDTVPIHDGEGRGPEFTPYAAGISGKHAVLVAAGEPTPW